MKKNKPEKLYYAVFEVTEEAVEVDFPDLPGCATFGRDFDEAFEMAVDALAGWLSVRKRRSGEIPKRSDFETLRNRFSESGRTIFPVPVDEKIMRSYQPKKRVNVVFTAEALEEIDKQAAILHKDRSEFLEEAALRAIEGGG